MKCNIFFICVVMIALAGMGTGQGTYSLLPPMDPNLSDTFVEDVIGALQNAAKSGKESSKDTPKINGSTMKYVLDNSRVKKDLRSELHRVNLVDHLQRVRHVRSVKPVSEDYLGGSDTRYSSLS